MKKGIVSLVLVGVLMAGVWPADAGGRHVYRHHPHHYYPHYPRWGVFAVGITTGAIATRLFWGTPVRTIIVEPAQPIVVHPAPVIVQGAAMTPPPSAAAGDRLSVTAQILNVRSGPGMNFPIIDRVYQGELLSIKGSASQWVYVQLPNGNFGWVMAEFTARASSPASG